MKQNTRIGLFIILSVLFLGTMVNLRLSQTSIIYIEEVGPATTIESPIIIGNPTIYFNFTNMAVCSTSKTKTYMDWRKTSKTSRQGKFMAEYMTIRNGLLYDKDNFIGVALGSYFGDIGDRFIFTLNTGIELRLIKVEEKSDSHTNNGCEQKWDRSVIEFVIDPPTNKFKIGSNGLIANGNYNNLTQFKGSIISIKKEVK